MNMSPAVLIRGIFPALIVAATVIATGCSTTTLTTGKHSPGGISIAVAPFENLSNHRHAGLILTDLANTVLHVSPKFDVREVSDVELDKDIRLRRLETDPWERQVGVNTATATQLGAALEVSHVLAGAVGEYGFVDGFGETANVGLTLRLVKVETGEVVWAGSMSRKAATTAFSEESVHRLAHQVLAELLGRMETEITDE